MTFLDTSWPSEASDGGGIGTGGSSASDDSAEEDLHAADTADTGGCADNNTGDARAVTHTGGGPSSADDVDSDSDDNDDDAAAASLCPNIVLPLDTDPDVIAKEIKCSSHAFDICFHPHQELLAAALVSGEVALYRFREETAEPREKVNLLANLHSASCRAVKFFPSGNHLVSASRDRRCVVADTDGHVTWKVMGHDDGVNALEVLSESTFASGDDGGSIKIWDRRSKVSRNARSVVEFCEYEEYVSRICAVRDGQSIVALSGDKLGVYDIRQPRGNLIALSDPFGHDLQSIAAIRGGSKVLVGSDSGHLWIFSWGNFGAADDNISGHPQSIDALVALSDDTILSGCGDGILRVVTAFPNRVAGVIGEMRENAEAIEALAVTPSEDVVATCSLDEVIRFYDTQRALEISAKSREERAKTCNETTAAGSFFAEL